MSYENIIYELSDDIGTITFNRPKALNALNDALLNEFSSALDNVASDEDIRVLVLTGSGEKSFVAGADIKEIAQCTPLTGRRLSKKGQEIFSKLESLSIPVIAAVNGFALGGGCEIALACDFIYASEKAKFGLPEITLGLIPGYGGTQRLARLVGKNIAREMVFTGKMISASEAKEIGLVNKICPPEGLMESVMETAKNIASKGRFSLEAAKRVINSGFEVDLVNGCKIESDAFGLCMASVDAKEGTNAFMEKRAAKFEGKLV
ncbi:MAG: 3-hydroxybutyryl-CoA dehydratase [Candidatus Magnetoglobus multicellularis str. Araruama]|uniref:3-hydroxybutyryl-CoA dehydratase n=1 Tax=Candidatus Magnetoglobus multicellularis str. Araruama TaxID=890399 RepID=A0A1V1PAP8_9BACT|nr:MAG: 3-hydroxybutyryl-CoA dehydratase [Candidatus Magnetoglobus multicellularis str. Araruama]